MPPVPTVMQDLADSLNVTVAAARLVRENEGVMANGTTVELHSLPEGTGEDWREVSLAQLTAQNIAETTVLENAQTLSDTLFRVVPKITGIMTLITQIATRRISKETVGRIPMLAQNAIQRLKNTDGLGLFGSATTILGGAGNTMVSGYVAAAKNRSSANQTEPSNQGSPFRFVAMGFQLKDIQDEVVAGIGTYAIPAGDTATAFRETWQGRLFMCDVLEDDNIAVDSSTDAVAAVFPQEAIVLVQESAPRMYPEFLANTGGGSAAVYHYDYYQYGERSSGNWLFGIRTDATAPTS